MKKLLSTAIALSSLFVTGSAIASPFDSQCWDPKETLISRPNGASAFCLDDRGTLDDADNEFSLYKYKGSDLPYLALSIVRLPDGAGRIAISTHEMDATPPFRIDGKRLSIFINSEGETTMVGDEELAAEHLEEVQSFIGLVANTLGAIAP